MSDETTAGSFDFFLAIWRRKWFVAIFTVAAVISAIVIGQLIPKQYQTETKIEVVLPNISKGFKLNFLPRSSYEELARSDFIFQKIIDTLNLKDNNGIKLKPETLKSRSIVLMRAKFKVSDVPRERENAYRGLISFRVVGKNPEILAKIANTWSSILAEESENINNQLVSKEHEKFLKNYKDTQEELHKINNKLKIFKSEVSLLNLRQELTIKRAKLSIYQIKLSKISMKLKEKQAGSLNNNGLTFFTKESNGKILDLTRNDLSKLLKRFNETKEKVTISTSYNDNLTKMTDVNTVNINRGAITIIGMHTSPPETGSKLVDSPAMVIQPQLEGNFSGADSRDIFIEESTYLADEDATPKMEQLYEKTIRNAKKELQFLEEVYFREFIVFDQLNIEQNALIKVLKRLASKVESTRILVSGRTGHVRLTVKPIVPRTPFRPDLKKIAIIAILAGFFISILLCLFKGFIDYSELKEKNLTHSN